MASSGHVDVVIGDAGCVAVSDCPPFRKEIHTKQVLLSHCIIAFKVWENERSTVCLLRSLFIRFSGWVAFSYADCSTVSQESLLLFCLSSTKSSMKSDIS